MRPDPEGVAFDCALRGWPVVPLHPKTLVPLVQWSTEATVDPERIYAWWQRWPRAMVAIPAGKRSGVVVLDVDRKNGKNGFDTLAELGHATMPETPIVHSPSGGVHSWFSNPAFEIPTSVGEHGLGPGLDVLGEGALIRVPDGRPGGYSWDPHLNLATVPLMVAPAWLVPPRPPAPPPPKPVRPCRGLSPYADSAIQGACVAIRTAPAGQQHDTLVREAFAIGTLAGAGGIPADFARRALIDAGCGMVSHFPRDPWTPQKVTKAVNECFEAGLKHPRPTDRSSRRKPWR
jgi:hypothetical protein